MNRKTFKATATFLVLFLSASISRAQTGGDVYWRIDRNVKTCSMVIDPSLTQAQWHQFVKQVGAISSFKSLGSAKSLGKMHFQVAVDYGRTPVDQHDPAWINTFVHPDEECPLGDAIAYPALRASMGVSDNIDVGASWTAAPGANYGMVGGEIKYAFLPESERLPAAAVRASVIVLTGVPDFDLNVYSIDVSASKEIASFTPYAGIKSSLVIGTVTTSKVKLNKESIPIAQGYAGVEFSLWVLNLAAEYNVSSANTFALAIGHNF